MSVNKKIVIIGIFAVLLALGLLFISYGLGHFYIWIFPTTFREITGSPLTIFLLIAFLGFGTTLLGALAAGFGILSIGGIGTFFYLASCKLLETIGFWEKIQYIEEKLFKK